MTLQMYKRSGRIVPFQFMPLYMTYFISCTRNTTIVPPLYRLFIRVTNLGKNGRIFAMHRCLYLDGFFYRILFSFAKINILKPHAYPVQIGCEYECVILFIQYVSEIMNLLRETQTLTHTYICTKQFGEPVYARFSQVCSITRWHYNDEINLDETTRKKEKQKKYCAIRSYFTLCIELHRHRHIIVHVYLCK